MASAIEDSVTFGSYIELNTHYKAVLDTCTHT